MATRHSTAMSVGRRRKRVVVALPWKAMLLVPLVGSLFLLATTFGLRVRTTPVFVNRLGLIEDIACTYTSGLATVEVLVRGEQNGARCSIYYRYGSSVPCEAGTTFRYGLCERPRALF
jgi:hypothetical protein